MPWLPPPRRDSHGGAAARARPWPKPVKAWAWWRAPDPSRLAERRTVRGSRRSAWLSPWLSPWTRLRAHLDTTVTARRHRARRSVSPRPAASARCSPGD